MSNYVGKKRKKLPALGEMAHRVVLCTMRDVVDENGQMRLTREAALRQWASIEERNGGLYSPDGAPVEGYRAQRTHSITVRALDNIEISSAAWVYEERARRAPRWFKVLAVSESEKTALSSYGRYWKLDCRLFDRSEEASKPVGETQQSTPSLSVSQPLRTGVKL